MTNDELFEKINKRFDTLEQCQARTNTAIEALAAGQKDIRENMASKQDIAAVRAEMATKADVHDLRADLGNKFKQLNERVEAVEDAEGIPNPHKH